MKNLPRWLFASLAKHLKDIADTNSIPFFVEGVYERESDFMEVSHAEFRVTGPNITEVSNGYYNVNIVANLLLTSIMESEPTAYTIVQWGGIFQEALLDPIPIYKLGVGADDTGALIGCLQIKKAASLYHFGQISKTDRIRQSEVDAVLEMEVKESQV